MAVGVQLDTPVPHTTEEVSPLLSPFTFTLFYSFRHYEGNANDHQAEFVVPFVLVSIAVGNNIRTAESVSSKLSAASILFVYNNLKFAKKDERNLLRA